MHFPFFDFHEVVQQHKLGEVGEVHIRICIVLFKI